MNKLVRFPVAFMLLFTLTGPVLSQEKTDFSKNGAVHDQVIHAWNHYFRDHYAAELQKRLFEQEDVYVLYDVQIGGLQAFTEMTRRCKDLRQIAELADLLSPVFSVLKPIPGSNNSTGWICSGGNICTAYGLLGKEVPLCSVQFLGLLGALATSISENIPPDQQTVALRTFVKNTFNTMAVQLDRWLTVDYFSSVQKRLQATVADVKDKNSGYYFTDRDLWYLTVLSDLSELQQSGVQAASADGKNAFEALLNKKGNIKKIFDLFVARSFLTQSPNGIRAEIDKGFWKYHFDNRYAGYTGTQSPVSWEKEGNGEWKMRSLVQWNSSYLVQDAGWDISHSRRLVPAFETFIRNRENIKRVWGAAFDPVVLCKAYANQIVEKLWNGNTRYPLFSNLWSGDNGWYRVAYASQTGRQFAGYPPYGLSSSIPDGGYAVWGAIQPTLHTIFRTIFQLSQSDDTGAKSFMAQYYPQLSGNRSDIIKRSTNHFAFLSDLVELPLKSADKQEY
ncbi:hypothetical protein LL912_08240 [Niabella sp. CC-SYL272]|uniref:hypothetical protein n=1 Tax=Niabella agricola TaxID=2891571 RepID=UPI001F3A1B4D|nr:hypothetical protein [Niabella agricola]MCF3108765.1 hypothetical protein [Niabella agricola]